MRTNGDICRRHDGEALRLRRPAIPTHSLDPTFEVPQGARHRRRPDHGDLLVADPGAEGVRRYDTSGTLLETIATPSINPAWIVTAPDGSFYVAPAEGPDVTHFSGAGAVLGTISGVGSLHGLAYDASRSLVVVAVGDKFQAYSPAGALLGQIAGAGWGRSRPRRERLGAPLRTRRGNLNLYAPANDPRGRSAAGLRHRPSTRATSAPKSTPAPVRRKARWPTSSTRPTAV